MQRRISSVTAVDFVYVQLGTNDTNARHCLQSLIIILTIQNCTNALPERLCLFLSTLTYELLRFDEKVFNKRYKCRGLPEDEIKLPLSHMTQNRWNSPREQDNMTASKSKLKLTIWVKQKVFETDKPALKASEKKKPHSVPIA